MAYNATFTTGDVTSSDVFEFVSCVEDTVLNTELIIETNDTTYASVEDETRAVWEKSNVTEQRNYLTLKDSLQIACY